MVLDQRVQHVPCARSFSILVCKERGADAVKAPSVFLIAISVFLCIKS